MNSEFARETIDLANVPRREDVALAIEEGDEEHAAYLIARIPSAVLWTFARDTEALLIMQEEEFERRQREARDKEHARKVQAINDRKWKGKEWSL